MSVPTGFQRIVGGVTILVMVTLKHLLAPSVKDNELEVDVCQIQGVLVKITYVKNRVFRVVGIGIEHIGNFDLNVFGMCYGITASYLVKSDQFNIIGPCIYIRMCNVR